ncbi:MAG: efflux RND transporter periplasmic adaptor subunit [Candidatus Aquilonibacter sp.]
MNRTRNIVIVVAALLLVIVFAVVAAKRGDRSATPVKLQKLSYSTFTIKLPENGTVMNADTVTVPSLVGGNIGQIYVKAGSHVSAGELLATIENPTLDYNASSSQADYTNAVANVATARIQEQNQRVQYQAQVDTNKSALDEARRVYDADIALLDQKAIARNQVDVDKAKLDQAQVAYDQAVQQLKLGAVSGYGMDSVQAAQANAQKSQIINAQNQQQVAFTRIVAPISGVIQTVAAQASNPLRSMQPGDAVTAGEGLFSIAGVNKYVVKAQVDEQDIINVHVGQAANVTGQDFPGRVIPGHVSRIEPVAQKSTDTSSTAMQVLTTIALDASPPFLKDGMSADVDILTSSIPHSVVVPNDAINKNGKSSFVYVVQGGVAKKRSVTLGRSGDSTTQVLSGLTPGDVIVAAKVPALTDGARVTASPSPSAAPSSS